MKIILRKEAIESNMDFYFTGKECKHGHVDSRRTKTGSCVTCDRLRQLTEKTKAYQRKIKATDKYVNQRKEYREKTKHLQSHMSRKSHIKRTYGLSLDEFDALLESQDGMCWICNDVFDTTNHVLITVTLPER